MHITQYTKPTIIRHYIEVTALSTHAIDFTKQKQATACDSNVSFDVCGLHVHSVHSLWWKLYGCWLGRDEALLTNTPLTLTHPSCVLQSDGGTALMSRCFSNESKLKWKIDPPFSCFKRMWVRPFGGRRKEEEVLHVKSLYLNNICIE